MTLREDMRYAIHDAFGSYIENLRLSGEDYEAELASITAKNLALFRAEIEGLENPHEFDPRLSGTFRGVASSCLQGGFEECRQALLARLEEK